MSNEWGTPQWLFERLDSVYRFGLDVCAAEWNAKCASYFTKEADGLKQDWAGYGTVWCNPPYSRGEVEQWVDCAHKWCKLGVRTVLLLPARTEQPWFQEIAAMHTGRFIPGRLRFEAAKNEKGGSCARFPSVLVDMDPGRYRLFHTPLTTA